MNHGQVFSREKIYENVFGYEGESDNQVIVEHIKNIRHKLSKYGMNPIETVWELVINGENEKQVNLSKILIQYIFAFSIGTIALVTFYDSIPS